MSEYRELIGFEFFKIIRFSLEKYLQKETLFNISRILETILDSFHAFAKLLQEVGPSNVKIHDLYYQVLMQYEDFAFIGELLKKKAANYEEKVHNLMQFTLLKFFGHINGLFEHCNQMNHKFDEGINLNCNTCKNLLAQVKTLLLNKVFVSSLINNSKTLYECIDYLLQKLKFSIDNTNLAQNVYSSLLNINSNIVSIDNKNA